MSDKWMPTLRLALTRDQFERLPRNAAYRYELLDGQVFLSPRPQHYHALLDLRPLEGDADVPLRRLRDADWEELAPLFAASFRHIQPFGSLDEATRLEAARGCLERTRSGGDGPWIERASFVSAGEANRADGAILVTLLPDGDPCEWASYGWRDPPPADCVQRRLGRPHLTWVFVAPTQAGQGIGTALLAAAVRELLRLGYPELASTFMVGNDSSMLWHWRNGFRLLTHPGSPRALEKRWRQPSE
jgi:GNAT superfamily N-acetyltransferase